MANPKVICVYVVTCSENGRQYVGATKSFAHRKRQHLYSLRHGQNWIPQMQADFDLYGESNFVFTILSKFDNDSQLIQAEQYWMDKLLPEYNLVLVAGPYISPQCQARTTGRPKGSIHSQEEKEKRSASLRKYWAEHPGERVISQEQRQHLSEINMGENNPNYGSKWSEDRRKTMVEKCASVEYKFLSPIGKVVQVKSLQSWCAEMGLSYSCMRDLYRGKKLEYNGWRFISAKRLR